MRTVTWIILILVLAGMILWQRQRLLRFDDPFDDEDARGPDGDADANGRGR
jgi:hypothetical protein